MRNDLCPRSSNVDWRILERKNGCKKTTEERSRSVLPGEIEHEVEYREVDKSRERIPINLAFCSVELPLLSAMQLNACIRRGTIDWNLVGLFPAFSCFLSFFFFSSLGESCVNGLQPFASCFGIKNEFCGGFKLILKLIVCRSWNSGRVYASLIVELSII